MKGLVRDQEKLLELIANLKDMIERTMTEML
jgi:hypothetical protein